MTGTVLVVDDLAANRRLLQRLLMADGHHVVTAADGDEAIARAQTIMPDVILMDVRMPKRDGFEACAVLKTGALTRLLPVVLMTGSADRADRMRAIEIGADDFLTKPIDDAELRARIRSLIRIKRHTDELDSAETVILSLALTIEARDPSTEGHCQRLAAYGVAVGERLGLPTADLDALYRGGYLHDVGKIGVPDAVLLKPGRLTAEEFRIIQQHPIIGDRLCGNLRALHHVRPIVRHHHERLDGTGYPDGLRGDAIPLLAQIVSVVDVYDALTTRRPYKAAWSADQALEELRAEARRGWRQASLVETLDAALTTTAYAAPPANELRHSAISRSAVERA